MSNSVLEIPQLFWDTWGNWGNARKIEGFHSPDSKFTTSFSESVKKTQVYKLAPACCLGQGEIAWHLDKHNWRRTFRRCPITVLLRGTRCSRYALFLRHTRVSRRAMTLLLFSCGNIVAMSCGWISPALFGWCHTFNETTHPRDIWSSGFNPSVVALSWHRLYRTAVIAVYKYMPTRHSSQHVAKIIYASEARAKYLSDKTRKTGNRHAPENSTIQRWELVHLKQDLRVSISSMTTKRCCSTMPKMKKYEVKYRHSQKFWNTPLELCI